jgi:hypothetical protein
MELLGTPHAQRLSLRHPTCYALGLRRPRTGWHVAADELYSI